MGKESHPWLDSVQREEATLKVNKSVPQMTHSTPVSAATGDRVNSIQMVIYSKTGSYCAYIFARML